MNDLKQLQNLYDDRRLRLSGNDRYSPFNSGQLFLIQQRERAVLNMLKRHGITTLTDKLILEVGCGRGNILAEYLNYPVLPQHLHGIDYLEDRVREARLLLPHLPLICADGQRLPFGSQSVDIVMQYTAFSSITDISVKQNMALEMLRVVKTDGLILWFDFWINPFSKETKGIRMPEVKRLFPGATFDKRRIILAPPIARRIAPFSWIGAVLLESIRVLNTHFLIAIRPSSQ